jgi:hypothetical protein
LDSGSSAHARVTRENTHNFANPYGGFPRANRQYFTGAVATQDMREGRVGWIHSLSQEYVGRVQRGVPHFQEYLAGSRLRIRHITQTKSIDTVVRIH